jgi:hypothetical protein
MARIRSLKPEFWTDSKLVRLSRDARLFYAGTWNFAMCDNGHLPDDADQLKMQIFPADEDVSVEELVQELVGSGRLLRLWSDDGRTFLQIKKLADHQKLEKRWSPRCQACQATLVPPPPESSPKLPEPLPTSPHRPETPATSPQGGIGKDSLKASPSPKGEETPGQPPAVLQLVTEPAASARKTHTYPPHFEEFWSAYPKRGETKGSKFKASKEWDKALKIVDQPTLMAAVKAYGPQHHNGFPPDAERWLRDRLWETCQPESRTTTFEQLRATADAKKSAALIRQPWADPPQHPQDPTPRSQFLKTKRTEFIDKHEAEIRRALERRAG